MAGDTEEEEEDRRPQARASLKSHTSFNNYPNWKLKLRENCYKRIREDRTRLLWKFRLPQHQQHPINHKALMKSAFEDIVSDELRKIKDSSLADCFGTSTSPETDDALWQYDGLHTAYEGDCEELLLEMQRIFYEDLRPEQVKREPECCTRDWEDEEDVYFAQAVYEHMQFNDEQVQKEVWCPICKQGELQQNFCLIYCSLCELKLNKGSEVTLELLRNRLAEAHADHLQRGCRLKPKFCVESKFSLTALYIQCHSCSTFEIVI